MKYIVHIVLQDLMLILVGREAVVIECDELATLFQAQPTHLILARIYLLSQLLFS